jgi:hypothetical protein
MDITVVTQKLRKVAEDIVSLADSMQELCTDSQPEKETPKAPEKEKAKEPTIELEDVRKVLADKSRAGKTDDVRALIQKFGADRLSDIDPKNYEALIKEAEVL